MAGGWLPIGSPSSSFNGGRSQVGLNIPTLGDYAFLNMMKGSQYWSFISSPSPTAPVTPDLLNSDGYPISIVNGGVKTVFYVPPQNVRSGNYVIKWSGIGTIVLGMAQTPVAPSVPGDLISATSAGGRYKFLPGTDRFDVGISAIGSPVITNIRVVHEDDEALLDAGNVFSVKFKQKLAEARAGVIRFMDWLPSNLTGCTTWASRKPLSYVWYTSYELRSDWYCASSATATGAAYAVSRPAFHSSDGTAWSSGGPKDKDTIHVLFDTSGSASVTSATNAASAVLTIDTASPNASFNSVGETVSVFGGTGAWAGLNSTFTVSAASAGSVTINFNSTGLGALTGTVTIYHQGSLFSLNVGGSGAVGMLTEYSDTNYELSGNLYPVGKLYASLATLIYDADMNKWIKQGGDLDPGNMGLQNGVPPELMLQLAREVGAHPYFNIPFLACTPMTDYTTQLATMCKNDSSASWMIPRFEPPNELWNTARGFYQTGYAKAKANAYGWSPADDYHNWYGRALSTIGQAVAAVYSITQPNVASQTKYQVLGGVQTGTGDTSGNRLNSAPRFDSTKYILQTPQSGYTASAAKGWCTTLCIANYFTPSDYGQAAETTASNAYKGATFTGSISGTALTTADVLGPLAIGHTIQGIGKNGAAVTAGTVITGGSGSSWTVNNSQTVASMPMVGGADLTAPTTYAATVSSGSGAFRLAAVATLYANWAAWAQTFGIMKMCGYEGGYSPDLTSNGNSDVDRLRSASLLAPSLQAALASTFNSFVGNTGGGFTAEFPSFYLFAGSPYVTGAGYTSQIWLALNDVYQSPNPPQWDAIVAFNA